MDCTYTGFCLRVAGGCVCIHPGEHRIHRCVHGYAWSYAPDEQTCPDQSTPGSAGGQAPHQRMGLAMITLVRTLLRRIVPSRGVAIVTDARPFADADVWLPGRTFADVLGEQNDRREW